ncbi:Imm17 family immunity protein [Mesonia hippocampi]|uniref:Imm17 family immunity protein n=1 Tax=Mesonia hippocampi TaxID=1628250 RepID=UPI003CCD3D4D
MGVVFLILFIAIVRNKNWAISPSSGNQRFFYNTFGRKNFRIVIGTVYLLTSIIGIGGFFIVLF